MPSCDGFEAATKLYEEAVALYEAAKAEFEILQNDIAETIQRGYAPANATLAEEERLRSKMFAAAAEMSRRDRRRSQGSNSVKPTKKSDETILRIDGFPVHVRDLICIRDSDGSLSEIRFTIDGIANRDLFKLHLPVGVAVADGDDARVRQFRLIRFELGHQHTIYVYVKHV